MKRYCVTLTVEERAELETLLSRGKADVRRLKHALMLLKADAGAAGPCWPDTRVAEAVGSGTATVERLRKRFVKEGLERALSPYRTGGRLYAKALDGEGEARLIALACSAPPDGRGRWTLRLLASRMVDLAHVPHLSHETVRQALKKERPETAPSAHVVHPAPAVSRVRVPHGGCAGSVRAPA